MINMKNIHEFVIGTCKKMCPAKEATFREKQRLLHILEVIPGTEKNDLPRADKNRTVKSFSRSAAGKSYGNPENLRPPEVLLKTVNYLLGDVINNNSDISWLVKYDFIIDRLRAVRQDMIIQNLSRAHQIIILQPIIRFHAYSAYRCSVENINNFDPHINNTHLQECLKRLLSLYDCLENIEKRSKTEMFVSNEFLESNRPYFETLYLIFNLGDTNAICRSLELPLQWRTNLVETALKVSLNYINRNLFKVCRLLKELPISVQMVAFLHISELRRLCFKIMSVAYNSKTLTFPIDNLTKLLWYNSEHQLISDCKHYGLTVNGTGVNFSKLDFKFEESKSTTEHCKEIDTKLKELNVAQLLLNGESL